MYCTVAYFEMVSKTKKSLMNKILSSRIVPLLVGNKLVFIICKKLKLD